MHSERCRPSSRRGAQVVGLAKPVSICWSRKASNWGIARSSMIRLNLLSDCLLHIKLIRISFLNQSFNLHLSLNASNPVKTIAMQSSATASSCFSFLVSPNWLRDYKKTLAVGATSAGATSRTSDLFSAMKNIAIFFFHGKNQQTIRLEFILRLLYDALYICFAL